MSGAKHTPGPWVVRPGVCRNDHPDTSADVHGPDGQFVADCGCHQQATANAKLIAAAPALADEVEAFLRSHANTMDETGSCTCPLCVGFREPLRVAGRLP